MITKFKIFENENDDDPQIGNYVICKETKDTRISTTNELINFINNNIGKIVENYTAYDLYDVHYEHIPLNLRQKHFTGGIISFLKKDIIYFSKNKKSLIPYITSNKYNL